MKLKETSFDVTTERLLNHDYGMLTSYTHPRSLFQTIHDHVLFEAPDSVASIVASSGYKSSKVAPLLTCCTSELATLVALFLQQIVISLAVTWTKLKKQIYLFRFAAFCGFRFFLTITL